LEPFAVILNFNLWCQYFFYLFFNLCACTPSQRICRHRLPFRTISGFGALLFALRSLFR
jgi:hypothetical protein